MSERVDVSNGVEGKAHLLSLLQQEYRNLVTIAANLDDKQWTAPSPCEEWEVRDVIGHMVDVAESYLGYFTLAEKGWDAGEPLGWGAYPKALSSCAQSYRRLPRLELLARLEGLSEPLFAKLEALDANQWATMLIPHRYGGPLPPFVMAVFQLIDYAVHSWDVRVATGGDDGISYETSQPLVPFAFTVYNFLFDAAKAAGQDVTLQYDVEHPDGSLEPWTVAIQQGQLVVAPGAPEGPEAVLRLTPTELLLRVFRQQSCAVSGDEDAAIRFDKVLGTV
jgi:uncharacterized protein (TIGR03083 family)